jgi:hypothetical protein
MVHCHLVYGNQIWGCANASLITELYRKQKAAVRIISNSSYRAHTEPIFKQCNILPLPSKSNSLNCNLCSVPSKAICHPPSIMFGLQMKQWELKQYLCRFVILMIFLYLFPGSNVMKKCRCILSLKHGLYWMHLYTGAEHFGNVIFQYSQLTSKYHIDTWIDVNRTWQGRDKTIVSQSRTVA